MTKRKVDKGMNDKIKNLSSSNIEDLKAALPEKDNSLYIKYLRDLLTISLSEAYSDYLISSFENEAEKILHFRNYWLRWDLNTYFRKNRVQALKVKR
ncbi:hypothetical protein [Dysgonomonas sp. HDW5A]|uniref:hypothetical protein n=1 Tax=Dysgonomonas sp. HDW5A TaxID=2714926 RepID=UPI002105762A|nr:hypothetical protein [Dysgonomonas sp. HDW5A]